MRSEWRISPMRFERIDEIRAEVDRRLLAAAFQARQLPDQYAHQLPFMYAKSFLFALHTLHRTVGQISRYPAVKSHAEAAVAAIEAALPMLGGVRDSTAHVDERVQGKARNKDIQAKPIENRMISAPSGNVFVSSSLNGDNFGCTMEDGEYGEVPATVEAFNACAEISQKLLRDLPWTGPSRTVPSV